MVVPFTSKSPVPTFMTGSLKVARKTRVSALVGLVAGSERSKDVVLGGVWSIVRLSRLGVPVAPLPATSVMIALKSTVSPSATPPSASKVAASIWTTLPLPRSPFRTVAGPPSAPQPASPIRARIWTVPSSSVGSAAIGTVTSTAVLWLFHQPLTTGAPTLVTAPTVNGSGSPWSTVSVSSLGVPELWLPATSVITAPNSTVSPSSSPPESPSNVVASMLMTLLPAVRSPARMVWSVPRSPQPSLLTSARSWTVPPTSVASSAIGTVTSMPVLSAFQ